MGENDYELDLNPFNHSVQRFASVAAYEAARAAHCDDLISATEIVEDAITGNVLRVGDQLVGISTEAAEGIERPDYAGVSDVSTLSRLMLDRQTSARASGVYEAQPVLICAGPGTGKTWSAIQLSYKLASYLKNDPNGGVLAVPILIPIQRLATFVRAVSGDEGDAASGEQQQDLLLKYIDGQYAGEAEKARRDLLYQA